MTEIIICVVALVAVAAAYHVALRWLGKRDDEMRIAAVESRVSVLEKTKTDGHEQRAFEQRWEQYIAAQQTTCAKLEKQITELQAAQAVRPQRRLS